LNGTKKACPVTPSTSSARHAADIEALSRLCRLASSSFGLRSTDTMIDRISRSTGIAPASACSKCGASGFRVFSKRTSSDATETSIDLLRDVRLDQTTVVGLTCSRRGLTVRS
jgi:hypothetical protein